MRIAFGFSSLVSEIGLREERWAVRRSKFTLVREGKHGRIAGTEVSLKGCIDMSFGSVTQGPKEPRTEKWEPRFYRLHWKLFKKIVNLKQLFRLRTYIILFELYYVFSYLLLNF